LCDAQYAGVEAAPSSVYDFTVVQYGKERTLKEFDGQVTVVLNIASE
jgi:glutathione peroxidase-family protein